MIDVDQGVDAAAGTSYSFFFFLLLSFSFFFLLLSFSFSLFVLFCFVIYCFYSDILKVDRTRVFGGTVEDYPSPAHQTGISPFLYFILFLCIFYCFCILLLFAYHFFRTSDHECRRRGGTRRDGGG